MKARRVIACAVASTMVLAVAATPAGASAPGEVASGNTISFHQRLQSIDGLGFAEAFQRATLLRGDRGLSPASTQAIIDLMFNRETGAGASIVRTGIGSSNDGVYDHMKTIELTSPGSPTAQPTYTWDGDDGAQGFRRFGHPRPLGRGLSEILPTRELTSSGHGWVQQ